MPIPPPRLDDRSFADLLTELRGRIPVLTPEWTDLSESDPGITLLELMAVLGENVLYRFNQIPDATRAWLLRLLDVPLRPPTSAGGIVTFTPPGGAAEPVVLETPTVLAAGGVQFETMQDVTVLPLTAVAAAKIASAAPEDADLRDEGTAALDAIGATGSAMPLYYRLDTLEAPGAAGGLPLDVASAVDGALWVAIVAPDAPTREALLTEGSPLADRPLNLGVVLDPVTPPMATISPSTWPGGAATRTQIGWSVSTIEVLGPDAGSPDDGPPASAPVYLPADLVADSTDGLRQDGVVRLQLPRTLARLGVPVPPPFGEGAGSYPPALPGNPEVVCWLRAAPVAGGAEIPRLRYVGVNAAEAIAAVTAAPEYLGTGTGNPGQKYPLAHSPIQPDLLAVVLEVDEPDGWVPWALVPSTAASGRDDRVWTLDPEAGLVAFGDTIRGRAPQAGERIRVLHYRYGGGVAGNVPPGAVSKVESAAAVTVTNPLPMIGGAPGETVAEAMDRIPGEFRRHDRAVAATDFTELALATPGAEVGRAECLPRLDPRSPDEEAAGVVTVVVWPRTDPLHPQAPLPERGLLRRVSAQLEPRRLITTELFVVPPEYVKIAVSVAVVAKPGYSADAVRRWSELVLRQYLAPLPPFGPEGTGWPLGRRVHGPELEAAVLQVEGIEYINELLVGRLDPTAGPPAYIDGTVTLSRWQVVEIASIAVVVGDAATALGEQPDVGPAGGGIPIPVPVRGSGCC